MEAIAVLATIGIGYLVGKPPSCSNETLEVNNSGSKITPSNEDQSSVNDIVSTTQAIKPTPKMIASSLSGVPIPQETFSNQLPFFGSNKTQNTVPNRNEALLENFLGRKAPGFTNKKETKPFFKPQRDLSYVNGAPNKLEQFRDRIVPSMMRTSERPTQPIISGPGLNQGYTNIPSGGYQQADTLDIIRPKKTNELRALSNPKLTFRGRFTPGNSNVSKRSQSVSMAKNRPETYYNMCPSRYLTTTGDVIRETKRPTYIVKPTSRSTTSTKYFGDAVSSVGRRSQDPATGASKKIALESSDNRNLSAAGYRPKYTDWPNDLREKGLPLNNRDFTGTRTHYLNIAAPNTQHMNQKEYFNEVEPYTSNTRNTLITGNIRQAGNVSSEILLQE